MTFNVPLPFLSHYLICNCIQMTDDVHKSLEIILYHLILQVTQITV